MEKKESAEFLIIDPNEDICLFDADLCQPSMPTSKDLLQCDHPDVQLISQIEDQIQRSKTNFFKVEIQQQRPKLALKEDINRQESSKGSNVASNKDRQDKKKAKIGSCILIEGYIQKKYANNILFKWNTRYGVLSSQKLYLFDDAGKKKVMGCFNFKILSAEIVANNKEEIRISFHNECEDLILRAPVSVRSKWSKALERVIEQHSDSIKFCLKTNLKPFYQQTDTITEEEFFKSAETGDVLLFLTDHTAGKLQRFFTQSEFDHVAMVIKLNGQTMVFEANQNDGVALYKWNKYVKYFNLYQKIVFRKLKCWRKKELHHTLLSFAKKNLGKKFDIGAYKLLLKQESDFDWNQSKERGFFCSQLIAKALKSVGLLDPVKACCRYWPVDFSSAGKIRMSGASLAHEQAIVLKKHIKDD